jgi:hypothetical protein
LCRIRSAAAAGEVLSGVGKQESRPFGRLSSGIQVDFDAFFEWWS